MNTHSYRNARWGNYAVAFVITAAIFATAIFVSNYLNDRRLAAIRTTQDNISIDILSLETQFDLLAEHSCADIRENSVLSKELAPLGARLAYMESQTAINEDELLKLKRYYSLLEIKDLLLMKKVAGKCGLEPVVILYIYSNEGDCKDCEEQGYQLTALTRKYPQIRVYSFDYHLDLSALRTLLSINNITPPLPALVIDGTTLQGLQSVDDIEAYLPNLDQIKKEAAALKAPAATTTEE